MEQVQALGSMVFVALLTATAAVGLGALARIVATRTVGIVSAVTGLWWSSFYFVELVQALRTEGVPAEEELIGVWLVGVIALPALVMGVSLYFLTRSLTSRG